MNRRYYLPSFVIALVIVLLLFFLSKTGIGGAITNATEYLFSPLQMAFFHTNQNLFSRPSELQKVQEENNKLHQQLAHMQEIQNENKALHDQFVLSTQLSQQVLPATIVNMPGFIPGIIIPTQLVINQGGGNKVALGDAIISGENIIGSVSNLTSHFAQVDLLTKKGMSITVRDTQSGALGVLKGMGGSLLLDNVVLSDTLKIGDVIVTVGNKDMHGNGLPEGLIVGKIVSIDRDPSALFQKASIQSLVTIQKLTTVFVVIE